MCSCLASITTNYKLFLAGYSQKYNRSILSERVLSRDKKYNLHSKNDGKDIKLTFNSGQTTRGFYLKYKKKITDIQLSLERKPPPSLNSIFFLLSQVCYCVLPTKVRFLG